MASISWKNATSGNWATAKYWSTGTVPGAGDDVSIPTSGTYTVAVTSAIDVHSLTQSAGTLTFNTPGGTNVISGDFNENSNFYPGTSDFIDSQNPANATTLNVGGNMNEAGQFAIDTKPLDGGSALNVAGTLTVSGDMTVGNSTITGPTTVTVGHLAFGSNYGEDIELVGSTDTGFAATLFDEGNATEFGTSAFMGIGISNNALLEFATGSIVTIGSETSIELEGAGARIANASDTSSNSALSGLTTNYGSLDLRDGASLTTTAGTNLANYGTLEFYGFNAPAGSLTVGGTLTNEHGATLSASTLTTNGTFTNAGNASIDQGHIMGDVSNSGSLSATLIIDGQLTSSGTLDGSYQVGGALTDNGSMQVGTMVVGGGSSITGTVELSDWTNHGGMRVNGDVTIDQAGSLTDDTAFIDPTGNITLDNATIAAPKISIGGVVRGTGQLDGQVSVSGIIGATFLDSIGTIGASGGNDKLHIAATATVESLLDASTVTSSELNSLKIALGGGTLRLSILHPQDLAVGQDFTVMEGKVHGQFAEFQDANLITTGDTLDLGNGLTLELVYQKHDIQVDVVATPAHAGDALAEPFQSVDAAGNVSWQSDDTLLHHSSVAASTPDFG